MRKKDGPYQVPEPGISPTLYTEFGYRGAKEVANNQTIMIVDQVGSTANGQYTVDKVFSNTTLSLTVAYGDLSNGEFYTTANTTTITT